MPLNIKEIAKLAGVSVATVSRSLNKPAKVSDVTRQRILEIIEQLNYVPNPYAQTLSTGLTHTVACIVPTLRNEFFNQLVEGSQRVLGNANYKMLIYAINNDADFWGRLDQRSIDGMILSGSDFTSHLQPILGSIKVPYVLIENLEQMQDAYQDIPTSVYIEDYNGVQLALEYLYSEGNRCFGIVTGEEMFVVTKRRMQAVQDFFAAHKDCIYYTQYSNFSDLEMSQKACMALLGKSPRPTAIFTFNDLIAIAVLRCLITEKISVPEEIELMGFDDIPMASLTVPSLSTVSAPNKRLGEKAAEMLLNLIAGKKVPQSVLYPLELKLRESTKKRQFHV